MTADLAGKKDKHMQTALLYIAIFLLGFATALYADILKDVKSQIKTILTLTQLIKLSEENVEIELQSYFLGQKKILGDLQQIKTRLSWSKKREKKVLKAKSKKPIKTVKQRKY